MDWFAIEEIIRETPTPTDPLTVAALTATGTFLAAVVAVVLGQWWQSHRDNNRWQKETAQEKVRWEREQEREELRWEREREEREKSQNLADRKQVYGEFLSLFYPWYGWMGSHVELLHLGKEPLPMPDDQEVFIQQGKVLLARISLLAPVDVYNKTHDALRVITWGLESNDLSIRKKPSEVLRTLSNAMDSYQAMVNAMREDVGASGAWTEFAVMHEVVQPPQENL